METEISTNTTSVEPAETPTEKPTESFTATAVNCA